MRVLILFAHPVETSYQAALHRRIVDTLTAKGHDVDDCDLYGEGFQPCLTREERIGYHNQQTNRASVDDYVDRLLKADALVLVTPVWNFGHPAILKGFFDRVFLPGVSFEINDGKLITTLRNIKKFTTVTTYGGSRWRAFLVGDPPRKIATRVLRAIFGPATRISYLAHYDMNHSTDRTRGDFLKRVTQHFERF